MADAPAVAAPAPSTPDAAAVVAPVVDPAANPALVADPALKAPDPAAIPDPKAADPAALIVPEKYDFKDAKLPENFSLDSALVDSVAPALKAKGFTQAEANDFVKTYAEALVKAETAAEAKRESDFKTWMANQVTQHQAALRQEWGSAYDTNMVSAQRGMARIFGPAGVAILNDTGLGNHPEFVRAFHKVGLMVAEDQPPNDGRPPNSGKSTGDVLYPSMTAN